MAQCSACKSELTAYDRRCRTCGAGVMRSGSKILAEAPSNWELLHARLCHLLALPGMLILGLLVDVVFDMVGILVLVPLNLIIPLVFSLLYLKSRFVRNHSKQVINFQILWTLAMYAIWYVPFPLAEFLWWPAYFTAFLGGLAVVAIASNDAGNAGEGRYPIRIPIG